MALIHLHDKRRNVTYVYESTNYWDKEAKKYKAHRKLIGKLDENGEIVPTGKRGRPKKEPLVSANNSSDNDNLQTALLEAQEALKSLQRRYSEDVSRLNVEIEGLKNDLLKSRQKQMEIVQILQKTIEELSKV